PRINTIVDGDQPCVVIGAELAEVVGALAATDAGQVFGDDKVLGAAFDDLFGLVELLAVEVFAASLAADAFPLAWPREGVGDVLANLGDLVIEATFILVLGADAGDTQDLQRIAPPGDQGWMEKGSHPAPPCCGDAEAELIDPVGQSG